MKQLHGYDAGAGGPWTVTVAADTKQTWVLDWIHVAIGLSGALAATETLTVTIGGVTKWQVDVILDGTIYGGPAILPFEFPRGLYGAKNKALVVRLTDIATAVGTVNVGYH